MVSSTVSEDDSQAVISLCHVERRRDGHWLIPDPYLPCLLNDEDVTEATLLSQGKVCWGKSSHRTFLQCLYILVEYFMDFLRQPESTKFACM